MGQGVEELVKSGILKTKYCDVDLRSINWLANPYNHTSYIFIIHKMDYMLEIAEHYMETREVEYRTFMFQIMRSFYDSVQNDMQNPWAFHDHAVALRASNVSKIIEMGVGLKFNNDEMELLRKILMMDLDKLKEESFYTRFTNHGLDQSIALYEGSFYCEDDNYVQLKTIAIERIKAELKFMFCEDGGHKENSPAYLVYGIHQLQNAIRIVKKYEGNKSETLFSEEVFRKILYNLSFFVRNDRTFPLIGDTTTFSLRDIVAKELWSTIEETLEYQNYLYAVSSGQCGNPPKNSELFLDKTGYVVLKSFKSNESDLHFVFKCGHLSNYHRHNDDLHFTLFYDGEEWFADGGLYEYAERDKYRRYFRSHQSHNISYLDGAKAHRNLEYSQKTRIDDYCNTNVSIQFTGVSYMFEGCENYRKVTYDKEASVFHFHDYWQILDENKSGLIDEVVRGGGAYICYTLFDSK